MAFRVGDVAGAAEVVGVVEVEVALGLRFGVGVGVAGGGIVGVGGGLVHDGGTGGAAVGTPVGVLGPAGGDGYRVHRRCKVLLFIIYMTAFS